jgi:ABC-type lipoprotein release transport system permease subunit
VGWAVTAALGQVLKSQLFGVSPGDPWTVAVVSMVLLVSGLGACWLPARRAARVDPVTTLRAD